MVQSSSAAARTAAALEISFICPLTLKCAKRGTNGSQPTLTVGRGGTGGVINSITKRPTGDALRVLTLMGGTASYGRFTADVDDENVVPGPAMTIYHPLDQEIGGGRLFVHAQGDPYALVTPVTRIIRELSSDQVVEQAA